MSFTGVCGHVPGMTWYTYLCVGLLGISSVSSMNYSIPDAQRYSGKVTIVTGGARGIGRGCVETFGTLRFVAGLNGLSLVCHGSNVVFGDVHEDEGKRLEHELNASNLGEAMFVKTDFSKEEDIQNLVQKTLEKYERIDCLINNAGKHPPLLTIEDFPLESFKNLLDVNLFGYFLMAKYALPHLRKTAGNIVNIASFVASAAEAGSVTYAASKGGVTAMTKALAIDEAKYNVRVNSEKFDSTADISKVFDLTPKQESLGVFRVSPGKILTPMFTDLGLTTPEIHEKQKKTCVLGRFGTAEEVGKACLFFATDGTFCTGVDLLVTGGAELGYGVKS